MEEFRETWIMNNKDIFQLAQSCFISYRKKLEEMNFVDNEFLHKEFLRLCELWCYMEDIAEDVCS